MFDLSFAETVVIGVVALLVVGPEDLPKIIRTTKGAINKVKDYAHEFLESSGVNDLKNEAEKLNGQIGTIVDLDGNEQPTYDISDLLKEKKKTKKSKLKKTNKQVN